MNEELKPCPFCGSRVEVRGRGNSYSIHEHYEVHCLNDDCYLVDGADYNFDTKEEAATEWQDAIKPHPFTEISRQK
jgi:hypothetical protein